MILKVRSYEGIGENWVFVGDVTEVVTGYGYFRAERGPVRHANDPKDVPARQLGVFERPIAPKASEYDRPLQFDKIFLPLYFPTEVEVLASSDKQAFVKVHTVCLTRRGNLPIEVAFHEAYLLNDNGKTIERL